MTRPFFLFFLVALATASPTFARAVLLTPEGTLYSIEAVAAPQDGPGVRYALQLTVRRDGTPTRQIVPPTNDSASHSNPSLAFDEQTGTLFLFWQRAANPMATELLVIRYRDGEWSNVTRIDDSRFRLRFGLEIAATSRVRDEQGRIAAGTTLHALWWEQSGDGEEARYAMVSVIDGSIEDVRQYRLLDFIPEVEGYGQPSPVLRYGGMAASNEKVDVIFGDWRHGTYHRIDVVPIAGQGVIRIPNVTWRGSVPPPPRPIDPSHDTHLLNNGGNDFAIYDLERDELRYVVFRGGEWKTPVGIALDESVPVDAALSALRTAVR